MNYIRVFLPCQWRWTRLLAMRILGVLVNIQMRVKDLENESIPCLVSFFKLIEDEKFCDDMVV